MYFYLDMSCLPVLPTVCGVHVEAGLQRGRDVSGLSAGPRCQSPQQDHGRQQAVRRERSVPGVSELSMGRGTRGLDLGMGNGGGRLSQEQEGVRSCSLVRRSLKYTNVS